MAGCGEMLIGLRQGVAAAVALAIAGCAPGARLGGDVKSAIAEVNARENRFASYPQPDMTYLSFSKGHGFQVNFIAPEGKSWLWYPGNRAGLPEDYKLGTVSGQKAICWRHPSGSYNPATRTGGGAFQCSNLAFEQRTIVAAPPGDPYALATGKLPYRLDRCAAPAEFQFDRKALSC
ncbi:MAG: hypothetical protein ACJA1L_000201 [Paracoccaceae bacterium]|jgi:hypothetical protein